MEGRPWTENEREVETERRKGKMSWRVRNNRRGSKGREGKLAVKREKRHCLKMSDSEVKVMVDTIMSCLIPSMVPNPGFSPC